ncbi:MAG: PepSY domain-containing protein, partial [Gaiellaceae bacterium]
RRACRFKARGGQMKQRLIMIVTGIAASAALVLGGAAIAGSQGVGPLGDDEASLSGPAADRATAAALKITGGGTANAVERDSEHGATYEVEVTKPNGKTVDVYLDASYDLISVDGDSEQNDGGDAGEQER